MSCKRVDNTCVWYDRLLSHTHTNTHNWLNHYAASRTPRVCKCHVSGYHMCRMLALTHTHTHTHTITQPSCCFTNILCVQISCKWVDIAKSLRWILRMYTKKTLLVYISKDIIGVYFERYYWSIFRKILLVDISYVHAYVISLQKDIIGGYHVCTHTLSLSFFSLSHTRTHNTHTHQLHLTHMRKKNYTRKHTPAHSKFVLQVCTHTHKNKHDLKLHILMYVYT